MAESSPNWLSNFSFSHSVFKRLVQQTHKKPGLVCERVKWCFDLTLHEYT